MFPVSYASARRVGKNLPSAICAERKFCYYCNSRKSNRDWQQQWETLSNSNRKQGHANRNCDCREQVSFEVSPHSFPSIFQRIKKPKREIPRPFDSKPSNKKGFHQITEVPVHCWCRASRI